MLFVLLMWLAPVTSAQGARAIVSRVGPAYPEAARLMHIEGVVRVRIHILASGRVESAKAVSPRTVLSDEALRCALKWRYMPDTHASDSVVEITFALVE